MEKQATDFLIDCGNPQIFEKTIQQLGAAALLGGPNNFIKKDGHYVRDKLSNPLPNQKVSDLDLNEEFRSIISHAFLGDEAAENISRENFDIAIKGCVEFVKKLSSLPNQKGDVEYGEWQLCPKCNGDGHLGRYNSPNISTNATPSCDVCNGSKIIARPALKANDVNIKK